MINFFLKIFDFFLSIALFVFSIIFFIILKFYLRKINLISSNIVSLSRDSISSTKKLNSRSFLNDFYGHPGFKKTYVISFNDKANKLIILGKNILGVNLSINTNFYILNKLKFTNFIIFEIVSILKSIIFMKKTNSGIIELVTPGPLEFRAIIIKFVTNCKMMAQVRGNVDLLSHSLDKYFYFRIPRKNLIFKIISLFIHKLLSELFYTNCDLVIGYNKNNLDSAISNGADPKISRLLRIEIHKPIYNLSTNQNIKLEGFPSSGRVILIWSRLSQEKLLDESIKGFILAADIVDDLSLVIIGSGPYEKKLKNLVNLSNHSERIHFLGYRDREYISSAAKKSTLTIISFAGSSLVEAALLKLPIIAFDIEWHSELIRNNETGYLVDYSNTEHLRDKIIESINLPEKLIEMSENCYVSAMNMFDYNNYLDSKKRYMKILLQK